MDNLIISHFFLELANFLFRQKMTAKKKLEDFLVDRINKVLREYETEKQIQSKLSGIYERIAARKQNLQEKLQE